MERSINPLFNVHERYKEMHIINPYRFPLFIEKYGIPYIAYSLRLLSIGYGGSCMRIHRNSDDAELDIGFKEGFIDTEAFETFVGESTHYIKYWYDQSGNGRHIVNNPTVNPQLVVGSPTINSYITGYFYYDATSQGYLNFMHDGTTSCVLSVCFPSSNADPNTVITLFSTNAGDGNYIGMCLRLEDRVSKSRNNAVHIFITRGVDGTAPALAYSANGAWTPNQWSIVHGFVDADNATAANRALVYINGSSNLTSNARTDAVSTANHSYYPAKINVSGSTMEKRREMIFYDSDKSSVRTQMRDNQNAYFLVY